MTAEALTSNPPPPARARRSLREWFWRGGELRRAKEAVRQQSALESARLRHALAAAELAGRVVDGVYPLREGPAYWLSISLYRDAAYWALLAQSEALQAHDLAGAFAGSAPALLSFAADGEAGLVKVQAILLEKTSAQSADEDLEVQREDAALVRAFVEALLRLKFEATERVARVLFKRWLRTGVALVLLIACAAALGLVIRQSTRPADLARGKPWRTSSSLGECRPAQRSCLGVRTRILFHTNVERNPWFEIDLGEPRTFSAVEVENRDDWGPDAALPLALEVSMDAQQWTEVARRTESFDTWRAEFPPQRARYVRAHAMRTTALHLVRVSVYER